MQELPGMQDVAASSAFEAQRLTDARSAARRSDPAEAARQFEKLFASLLVKELRRGLPEGFFGQGPGADVYEGWLDEHVGGALAEGGGLGLRIALERDLLPRAPGQEASA